jgi:thiopeptide-type bacteriocin biosynthesis protein
MELCESLFHVDSDAVLEIVRGLDGDAGAEIRWRLALHGIDRLLEDFGFDLPRKYVLLRESARFSAREFGFEGAAKESVLDKYRRERAAIERALAGAAADGAGLPGAGAFQIRSERSQRLVARLRQLGAEGKLETPVHAIAGSLMHMHVNRILRSSARAQETILYQFLDRYYDSQLARRGIKGKARDAIRLDADELSAVAD